MTRPRAVIVGVQLPGVSDAEHASSLAELGRLADTLGLDVVETVTQRRGHLEHGTVIGEGKLKELAKLTPGPEPEPEPDPDSDSDSDSNAGSDSDTDADSDSDSDAAPATVVLVDHDLSPSQARNLEKATGAEVLDRSAVILAIFQRHARTREAKAQVEIARLKYMAPRLREAKAGYDRQRGGIGGKGAGESALELDRRRIRDRIAELTRELSAIEHERGTRRRRRAEHATVALVGYTNAGKSSLFRALTGSDVFVADRLFATLDTTVRALHPETKPRVLVTDTVGFIKKLPHDLVASFRSTLEEAADADLLVHVVDAADPARDAQIAVTREVLAEIGATESPVLLVYNKVDLLNPPAATELHEDEHTLAISAKRRADVARLRDRIVAHFERDHEEAELFVPYDRQRLVAEMHATARVLTERHDERGTHIALRADRATMARLRTALAAK